MSSENRKKYIFHILGAFVVGFWIVMTVIMVRNHILSNAGLPETNDSADNISTLSDQREWKEIFLNNRKVGYAVNLIKPFEGGYLIQEEILLKMNLMGLEKGLNVIIHSSADKDLTLKNFFFKMTSGVINYSVSGKVEDNRLIIETGRGRRTRRNIIELKAPPVISSGIDHMFKSFEIEVGDVHRITFFDPVMMAQNEAVFRVAALEEIKINRMAYEAFRVETEMWGNRLSFWLDRDGAVLKEEGFMGLSMIKSSAANAPMDLETGELDDFYEISSVSVDKKIPKPERLKSLRLRILDIQDLEMDLNNLNDDTRQKYSDGILEIKRERLPENAGFTMPLSSDNMEFRPWLVPEINIESDEREIVDKASEITGANREPVSAAERMMEWVYRSLEKRPVVNVPSALDVIRTKTGDCNEHATLLTALLRAAGIPARICVGLVYMRDRFYYHAWTEAWVGEWITLDPTLNQMPADVSHIRLARGNLDRQVEIIRLLGKLKLEVVDFEYD